MATAKSFEEAKAAADAKDSQAEEKYEHPDSESKDDDTTSDSEVVEVPDDAPDDAPADDNHDKN